MLFGIRYDPQWIQCLLFESPLELDLGPVKVPWGCRRGSIKVNLKFVFGPVGSGQLSVQAINIRFLILLKTTTNFISDLLNPQNDEIPIIVNAGPGLLDQKCTPK